MDHSLLRWGIMSTGLIVRRFASLLKKSSTGTLTAETLLRFEGKLIALVQRHSAEGGECIPH
jgi:hypothetical protein